LLEAQDDLFRHPGRRQVHVVKPKGGVHSSRQGSIAQQKRQAMNGEPLKSLAQQAPVKPPPYAMDPNIAMNDLGHNAAAVSPGGGFEAAAIGAEQALKGAMEGIASGSSLATTQATSQSDAVDDLGGVILDKGDGANVRSPWFKILEYKKHDARSPWIPTSDAYGTLSASDPIGFAKLSDEQIHALGGKKYWLRFNSSNDNISLYLSVDGINWTDTNRSMGYASQKIDMCEGKNIGQCTSWDQVDLADKAFHSAASHGSDGSTCRHWNTDVVGIHSCENSLTMYRCFHDGCVDQVREDVTVWIRPQQVNTHSDCEDFSGYYMDNGGFTVLLQQYGCLVVARNYARWPNPNADVMEVARWANNSFGTAAGEKVSLLGLKGWTLDLANNPNRSTQLFGMAQLRLEGTNDLVPHKDWYREPCNRFHGVYRQGDTDWLVNQSACDVNITKITDATWPTAERPYSLGTVTGNTMSFVYGPAEATGNLDPSLLIVTWSNTDQWQRGMEWL